ncbi:hypothetical protein DS596_24450 [Salmonella enterica subsp. enterica serovar Agona]|uniref:Uncharacterized protein n=2 Tax=Salmonella enterica TaxID=28901 RepID=A0A724UUH1_SALET|nr:hypothetical protein [Salmonella enterica]EBW3593446.1 hypothetical protein [Salmonella enterica subsp. enterica serovar Newport]EBX7511895.1 hypothetical protein [Salmonella enterica subsp. enterica serovar Agona]ECC1263650.1 hypothetical protein [Salmonella enterica subsp. enterica serovar Indiana]EAR8867985.1 hypothetical protein [Salmonella enterica]
MARSGDVFCTTGKTEIILNTKTAGGCGVAPFSSLPPLFRRQQTAAAACCATETNEVMDERGQILTTLKMRLIRSESGDKKARIMRAEKRESGDDVLVLAPGLSGLRCRLVKCARVRRRTDTGV